MQNVSGSIKAGKKTSRVKWKYLLDRHGKALIRSDGHTYEYYDIFSRSWNFDPFGSGTFNGSSKDSNEFHEIREKNVPDIIGTMLNGKDKSSSLISDS